MAAIAYDDIQRQGGDLAPLTAALRAWLGDCAMMAYLVMMAVRLTELHRTLKDTGTLYLHCDQTASHYLKIILDCIFSTTNYRNEIIWKRSNPKSHISTNFPTCTDTILRYSKGNKWTYHQPYEEHDPEYVKKAYKYTDGGGAYRLLPLLNPNDNRPNLTYEFLGITRVWRWTRERMQKAYDDGVVVQSKPGAVPQYKKYLHDSLGRTVTNCWTDIPQAAGLEALGYPTQKPLALLDRIIKSSSNEDDVVLDPFCGCGTTVESAAHLKRQWIGIDVTHYAITLIEKRLGVEKKKDYEVKGRPTDLAGAHELARRDKYQFQWWAAWLLGVQTYKSKKGADKGIDANIYFANGPYGLGRIIISVKGSENVSPVWVRELAGVVEREKAQMGILVTLVDPTRAMKADAAGYGLLSRTPHAKLPKFK